MEFETGKKSNNRQQYRRKPVHESDAALEMGKTQPQDIEFEEAVLGAIMLEKDAYSEVSDLLTPESFYLRANQLIYEAIRDLGAQQLPIDLLTVTQQLRSNGHLDEVGGAVHISELTSRVASAANIEYHAQIVAQKYLARELISYSSQIGTLAFDESIDVYDLMQEAEGKLFELSRTTLKRDFTQIDPVISEAMKKIQEAAARESGLSGLQTGYRDLDKMTSGWQNSDLIIIAARPAMGKTALVLSMAKNMAVDFNTPVAVFSLEMSNLQLVNRLISNVCNLESEKIKSGQLSQADWDNLMTRIKDLYAAPLEVYNHPANLFAADFVGNPSINFVEAKGWQGPEGSIELTLLDGHKAVFTPEQPLQLPQWFHQRDEELEAQAQALKARAGESGYVEKSNKDETFRYHIARVNDEDDGIHEEPVLTNEDLVLGIRPEFLSITGGGNVECEIYGAMPTGMESTVKVRIGEYLLTGVVFGSTLFTIGSKHLLDITGSSVMLFDRSSGRRITSGTLKLL